MMPRISGGLSMVEVPQWALLQRKLIFALSESVHPFLSKYVDSSGWLIWRDRIDPPTRDGADDFYEPFFNWPLAYFIGGDRFLLTCAHRQHKAITEQLTNLGFLVDDFERGYDAFHLGESMMFFYYLCLADPADERLAQLAAKFALLYVDERHGNYDVEHNMIRAPHTGSCGPRWGYFDGEITFPARERMRQYGLPYHDVPGVVTYDDLSRPELAKAMGATMEERMGRGDVAANLCLTSIVTNAYALTGEPTFRDWVLRYVNGWMERAQANGGLIPDNVGPRGCVGELIGGRWYGGAYGWSWPHGFYSVASAALVACSNSYLLTGNADQFDMARTILDEVWSRGEWRDVGVLEMSLAHHWTGILPAAGNAFVVPYRVADEGWFDYQPMPPSYPISMMLLTSEPGDRARVERIKDFAGFDWETVARQREKEDGGHEAAWCLYLSGQNPSYPEEILNAALEQVARRLRQIAADDTDPRENHIHHWQELNPVTTEALLHTALGAPSPLYNGGLLNARIAYFDQSGLRPGLPQDVAALVEKMDGASVNITLVNLSPLISHDVTLQAGAYAEHQFHGVSYKVESDVRPDPVGSYQAPDIDTEVRRIAVNGPRFTVTIAPWAALSLEIETELNVNPPDLDRAWLN